MADYLPKAEQLDTMNAKLAELNEHLQKREDFTAAMAKLDSATQKAESLKDGFSPTATVTQTSTGADISITDKNGTTSASVKNGSDANVTKENVVNALGYTPLESAPVTSVNGKVGAVEIAASDVGAISDSNGSVQNAHLASASVTTDKLAEGERMTKDNVVGALGYEPQKEEGTYELINSVTVTEEVTDIDITTDTHGDAFSLIHAYCKITSPTMSSAKAGSIYWRNADGTLSLSGWYQLFTGTTANVYYWAHIYGSRVEALYERFNETNSITDDHSVMTKNFDYPAINRLLLYVSLGAPVGAVVELYGIRA